MSKKSVHSKQGVGEPIIRQLKDSDDLAEITALINQSYSTHLSSGLRYLGANQTVEITSKRLAAGIPWVMERAGRIIGTATLVPPDKESPVALYRQNGVYSVTQLCVLPSESGKGLGRLLYEHVENHARSLGAKGIALDTAAPASWLIRYYQTLGYSIVGECDWRPFTNFSSVVMYKSLSYVQQNQ